MSRTVFNYSEMDPTSLINKNTFFIKDVLPTNMPLGISPPPVHRHPYYEMVLVKNGLGKVQIDFEEYFLTKGALCLLSPLQVHFPSIEVEENYSAYILRFDASIFDNIQFFDNISIFNFNYLMLTEQEYIDISTQMKYLCEEYENELSLKHFTLSNLLKILLIKLQRLLPATIDKPSDDTIFKDLNILIETNGYKIATPSDYAEKLRLSIRTLNFTIKKYTGLSAGEYIRSKTIIEAKRLLCYTSLGVKEIAHELGFLDACYFSRYFKRETTFSPLHYRKRL